MVPIPDGCNEHCKKLIAAVPADTEILAMDTVGDVVLIGTTKVLTKILKSNKIQKVWQKISKSNKNSESMKKSENKAKL